ncbi:MAG: hypothetical protein SFX73_25285 [Kofleriaceae bacterium]|nr:hypothetical protein [Kofleriaceae bacterium]
MTTATNHDTLPSRIPSSHVWSAALAGLLGLGAAACGDDNPAIEPDPVDAPVVDAPITPDAPPDAPEEPPSKIISETPGEHTFAELKEMCDTRGGYIQIHAACSGANTCAGFTYGDWGADAVLIEHTCSGVSGCAGLSCVVLPADSGKTGLQILEASLPDTEGVSQRSCNYCHAAWTYDPVTGETIGFDATKFRILVPPGSPRNASNWRATSAEVQARMIAFGAHTVLADGTATSNMAPYYKMYSKAEIERVVAYIRDTAEVTVEEYKTHDPVTVRRAGGMRRPVGRLRAPRGLAGR